MTAERDASAAISYTSWAGKGGSYSFVQLSQFLYTGSYARVRAPSADDEGYIARVDYYAGDALPARTGGVGIPSGGLTLPRTPVRSGVASESSGIKIFTTLRTNQYDSNVHLRHARSVGGAHAGSWCPQGAHPRGEDAARTIGSGTGRTLSSLTQEPKVRLADLFWCRSDVRYPIWYAPQSVAGTTCGTTGARACPSGVTIPTEDFRAWGRVNCYYTALRIDSTGKCVYPHPIPKCTDSGAKRDFAEADMKTYATGAAFGPADDGTTECPGAPQCADGGTKRDMTDAELAEYRKDDPSFTPKADGTTPCDHADAPPAQAGFTADACVTASLEIYENRTVSSDAESGVPVSDRTLAAATGRTAWDLDMRRKCSL